MTDGFTTPGTRLLARTALYAGLLAGTLDIGAAIFQTLAKGPQWLLQVVASGWLGTAAFDGGWPAAWIGLASHFGIMLVIAVIWVVLCVRIPTLIGPRAWPLSGLVWGVAVWIVMTYAVVPLSQAPLHAPGTSAIVKGLLTHMIAIGLPMAFVARRMLGRR